MPSDEFFGGWDTIATCAEPPAVVVDDVGTSGASTRAPSTLADELHRWTEEGPIVHEPTGIPTLDKMTGGGPTYGSRGIIQGAPDACKTATLVQLGDDWRAAGVIVGMHFIDEDISDGVTRFMQRRGFRRAECEVRGEVLALMSDRIGDGEIYFYDSTWTIEEAAADLANRANGRRSAYLLDSIQTAKCVATLGAQRDPSPREVVTANMIALRCVATKHRHLAIATSEMNRNAYRSEEAAEAANDMASGAESRAIEYQARWMVALRSVKGETDLVHCRIIKNKLGPSNVDLWLRIDRARQTLTETDAPAKLDREAARDAQTQDKRTNDAAAVASLLAERSGIIVRDLAPALAARHGSFSKERSFAALARLGAAVVRVQGKRRAEHMYLDGSKVDAPVLAAVPMERRAQVAASSPPGVLADDAKEGSQ